MTSRGERAGGVAEVGEASEREASRSPYIDELRELIVASAPDPEQAAPVRTCRADEPLDAVIPFSSVIVLGTVVAVEDRYGITVKRADLQKALAGGVTLEKLAKMIEALR